MTGRIHLARESTRVGGRVVHWSEAGAGPPVVLVHGLGASLEWWRPTIPRLVTSFRVHVVDLAGFGRARRQPVRLDLAAEVLAAWIRDRGLGPVGLVGHSFGGAVVTDLTLRFPELVERLVLVDAAGVALPGRLVEHLAHLVQGGRAAPLRLAPRVLVDLYRAGPVAIARGAHQVLAFDREPGLAGITVPTLVIWGERDRLIAPSIGRRIAAAIPGARLELIPRAGHTPMWDAPRAFNDAIGPFLEGSAGEERAERRPVEAPAGRREGNGPGTTAPDHASILAPTSGGIARRYLRVGPWSVHVRAVVPNHPVPGPPIVLLHGFVISSRSHARLLAALGRRRVVIAPDLPGFGWSSRPALALDVPGMADALGRILDAAGIPRAVLVGNGMGSQVAARFAAGHPDRVERVVLSGPVFDPETPHLSEQALRLLQDVPHERGTLWALPLPDILLTGLGRAWATLRHIRRHRIDEDLAGIEAPTLVVRGARDPLVSAAWAETVARLLPKGRLVTIARAGHAVNHSSPDRFAAAVETFLEAPAEPEDVQELDRSPRPSAATGRPA
jgi:2-hydroxy-6-oxonona-2,4-dienedioate hydrolase